MQINTPSQSTGKHRSPTAPDRRGATLVAALVCLLIVSLILLSVFKSAIGQRRQLRLEAQHIQAEFLAESGLERAVARLQKDKAFTGEVWDIPSKQFQSHQSAQVQIKVTKQDNSTTIDVVALFPKGSMKEARATKTLVLKTRPTNQQPGTTAPPAANSDNKSESKPTDKPPEDSETEATQPADAGESQR